MLKKSSFKELKSITVVMVVTFKLYVQCMASGFCRFTVSVLGAMVNFTVRINPLA